MSSTALRPDTAALHHNTCRGHPGILELGSLSIFFVLDAFQKSKTFYVALTIACNSLFHSAVGYDQGSSVAPFTSEAVNMRADSTSDMDNG